VAGNPAAGAVRGSGAALESGPGSSPLVLVQGDEELLVSRAIAAEVSAARHVDPDADHREFAAAGISAADLLDACSPTLFGGRRVIVLRKVEDLPADRLDVVKALMADPADEVTLVLQHTGGAKGKAIVDAARSAGARIVQCAPLSRAEDRMEFLRNEIRQANGRISPDAAAALLDAVGSDLREIAAVAQQLVSDYGGSVDAAAVAAYHRGRAEVTGFAVSDRAILGDVPGALETLRWALAIGVPPVLIADALADGVRSVARVTSAGRGSDYDLATQLGMPPWKVKRARSQGRGWTEEGLAMAMSVAAQVNADVKGVAVDAGYALERAVRGLAQARSGRA
jgi:DNA polymerase-3 subunit delta